MKDNFVEPWDGDAVLKWFERLDAQLDEIFSRPLPTPKQLEPFEFDAEPFDVDAIADIEPFDVDVDTEPPENIEDIGAIPFDVDTGITPLDVELFGDVDAADTPRRPETPRTGEGDGGRV